MPRLDPDLYFTISLMQDDHNVAGLLMSVSTLASPVEHTRVLVNILSLRIKTCDVVFKKQNFP